MCTIVVLSGLVSTQKKRQRERTECWKWSHSCILSAIFQFSFYKKTVALLHFFLTIFSTVTASHYIICVFLYDFVLKKDFFFCFLTFDSYKHVFNFIFKKYEKNEKSTTQHSLLGEIIMLIDEIITGLCGKNRTTIKTKQIKLTAKPFNCWTRSTINVDFILLKKN